MIAWESIVAAGKEEARLAIENGDVNSDGIPLITVVADGALLKRSYKHNYNTLSGVVSFYFNNLSKMLKLHKLTMLYNFIFII